MSRRRFDETFKRKVIQEYEAGGISCYCLGKKYGVDAKCVRSWSRLYKQHGEDYLTTTIPILITLLNLNNKLLIHTLKVARLINL